MKYKLCGIIFANITESSYICKMSDYKVVEVLGKRDLKRFIKFPDKLYKGCPQYVPALHSDQVKSLTKVSTLSYCKRRMWMVLDGDKVVGRICGMINPRYNALYGKKRARFGWFDTIDDIKVARLLLDTAEAWAKENGMTEIHGPLYYNTLGKQGMLVEVYDDREKLDRFLSAREEELERISKETEYKLTLLETARKRLRKEQNMNFDVTVKTIPERYAATVHMVIPHYEDEGMAWAMMGECKNMVPADPCLAAAEFLDKEYKEENAEIVVWMTVKGTYEDTEHVKFKTLPAVKVASCIIRGSYEQMGDATATVISWISENGYQVTGPMFNIYHVSPNETKNPDEYVTEVCFPIG